MVALIERGFLATLARDGRDLKNGRTGAVVRATVNRPGEVDFQSELGDDPRMEATIELQRSQKYDLKPGDRLTDNQSGEIWEISSIKFNCPPYAKKFGLVQKL